MAGEVKALARRSTFGHIFGRFAHSGQTARIPQKWVPVLRAEYAQI